MNILEHYTIAELQRLSTHDDAAMAELGRRVVDIQDPSQAEDELEGHKLRVEQAVRDIDEFRAEMEEVKTSITEQFIELFDSILEIRNELVDDEE